MGSRKGMREREREGMKLRGKKDVDAYLHINGCG